jgi:hypothetical protein
LPGRADVVIDEFDLPGQDFSDDSDAPTPLGVLGAGLTEIVGVVISTQFAPDADLLTFNIAPGTQLDSISLNAFDGERHFFGLDEGARSVDPNTGNGQELLIARLAGASEVGSDLLGPVPASLNFGPSDTPTSLGPGDYTMWIQENNQGFYGYSLTLEVSAIPEPSAACVLWLGAGVVLCRRGRRRLV